MRPIRWRLRPLVVLLATVTTAAGLATAYGSVRSVIANRLTGLLSPSQLAVVLDDFANAFAIYSVIAIAVAALLGLAFGSAAARMLARVRANAVSRAKREDRPIYEPAVVELRALAHAIDRLADESEGREIEILGERNELGLLIGSASEGILLVGPDGRIIQANPAARALLGLPDDCRGQPLRSLIRNAQFRSVTERLIIEMEPVTTELTFDERRLFVNARPLIQPDPTGSPEAGKPSTIITLVDLTELRRLEGVRRDFVANVSHELKTPLTSIRGYVETLMSDDLEPSMQRQFLDVIQKNAERLHSIVDDLLDLSKLESGGWQPNVEDVSVAQMARDVWEICADRARERGIRYEGPAGDALVRADKSAFRQILSNLFDNALRYTPRGGTISVVIEAGPPSAGGENGLVRNGVGVGSPGLVSIDVRDTGAGIPGDSLPRIFERFYRVDPARSRAEGGTGLGLSIVKHLTESMDGEVTATSAIGKGTTVRVRLPAA